MIPLLQQPSKPMKHKPLTIISSNLPDRAGYGKIVMCEQSHRPSFLRNEPDHNRSRLRHVSV
ncbi:MAG: hypothetical protein ACSHX7_05630 [Luteolibacter sp.]